MKILYIIVGLCCSSCCLLKDILCCQDEMFYLATKLNQSSANTRCIEMGYQGLAELKTQQQQKLANDLIYNKGVPVANVWIGLKRNISTSSWWWESGEEWVEIPGSWDEFEPDRPDIELCIRLKYRDANPTDINMATTGCWINYEALCHRTKDLSSNYMELLYSDIAAPVGLTAFRVRSMMDCVTSCVLDCSCQAVHYSRDECRLMTYYYYYLLNSVIATPTDSLGVIYHKKRATNFLGN